MLCAKKLFSCKKHVEKVVAKERKKQKQTKLNVYTKWLRANTSNAMHIDSIWHRKVCRLREL